MSLKLKVILLLPRFWLWQVKNINRCLTSIWVSTSLSSKCRYLLVCSFVWCILENICNKQMLMRELKWVDMWSPEYKYRDRQAVENSSSEEAFWSSPFSSPEGENQSIIRHIDRNATGRRQIVADWIWIAGDGAFENIPYCFFECNFLNKPDIWLGSITA